MPRMGVLVFSDTPPDSGCTCGPSHLPALAHVANRPIAHHALDALLGAGVEDVIIAGTADMLIDVRACLNRYASHAVNLEYAPARAGSDSVTVLRAAAAHVGAAPCIVQVADGLLDGPLAPYADSLAEQSLDLVLLCDGASLVESPGPALEYRDRSIQGILCEAGVGVFGPGAFRDACQANPEPTTAGIDVLARRLSDDGRHVQVCLAQGWLRYRGKPRELLDLNRLALDLLAPQSRPRPGFQNRIEGRVVIHETATVSTSVLVGPIVVGEGAEITNSYIGPYTSIGPCAQIEGVEIERSIISANARVLHVGTRLVSSLVGRGAHVFRDFSLPRAMRLRVGEGDEVALC
jgi:glucose-1-phosphate thymidylyltransferase